MKLLKEIISILSSQGGSLTDALLKTKVLLYTIGHQELAEWVNNELNGYSDEKVIPSYRVFRAQILVNAANIAYQINGHPIPTGHLDEDWKESLTKIKLGQSLAVLEEWSKINNSQLQFRIPMELNGLLGKGLDPSFQIQQAWKEISRASLAQVFVQVRSRLLEFALTLEGQVGDFSSDEELKEKSSLIDTPQLFNQSIFGDNTTIIVGNNNKQDVKNKVIKGDFNSLAQELRKHGVGESDISELQNCIQADSSHRKDDQRFGPAVRNWLCTMLSKAVDASWQIELGIASNVLYTALQNYYG